MFYYTLYIQISFVYKSLINICVAVIKEYSREKCWIYFRKSAGLSLSSVVCCCADRKGGTTYEKHDKRTMARKHYSARGQPNQLKGYEGTARLHGKASRGLGKELHRRTERNIREVPRLLEWVHEPCLNSHLRVCLQVSNADSNRSFN